MAKRSGTRRRCQICIHPDRPEAELLLAGGASARAVSRKMRAMPYHSLWRHWRAHVSAEKKQMLVLGPCIAKNLAARVASENTSVLDNLKIVRAGLFYMYDAALSANDLHAGALLAGKLCEVLSVTARLTGELATSPLVQNNVQNIVLGSTAAFAALQARLIRACAKHPAVRDAIIAELRSLESAHVTAPESAKLIEAAE